MPRPQSAGHGLGLSLPSAMPLDETMLAAVVDVAEGLGGFGWYSEHLSVFVTPQGNVPNAQAGLGLPVSYDDEVLDLLVPKLRRLSQALACRVLLENPAQFTPVSDMDYSEPEFLNRLYRECQWHLLDLHNSTLCPHGVEDRWISHAWIRTAGGIPYAEATSRLIRREATPLDSPTVWELERAYMLAAAAECHQSRVPGVYFDVWLPAL